MRIAIPRFGERVSPRFDCAPAVEIVDWTESAIRNRTEIRPDKPDGLRTWVDRLVRSGVDVLLCGGIRRCDYFELNAQGIQVFAGLAGPSEPLLAAFCRGRLTPGPPWATPNAAAAGAACNGGGGRTMPRGDGTGPTGQGPGTGRGQGRCGGGRGAGQARGQGNRRGQPRKNAGGPASGSAPGRGKRKND